jgi:hypothetical protein
VGSKVSGAEDEDGAELSALVVGKDVMGRIVAPLGALFAVVGVLGGAVNVKSPVGKRIGVSVVVDRSSPSHPPSTRTMSFARLALICSRTSPNAAVLSLGSIAERASWYSAGRQLPYGPPPCRFVMSFRCNSDSLGENESSMGLLPISETARQTSFNSQEEMCFRWKEVACTG